MKLRVRELRKEADETQAVVAEGAGISIAQVSRIERGLSRPKMQTLAALAVHFKCPPANLIDGMHTLTNDEAALLEDYRVLAEDEKTLILDTTSAFARRYAAE